MDIIFHLLLPIMLLLLVGIRLSRIQLILLAFFSILPDFDRLIFLSKQGFHSLLFPVIFLPVLFLLSRKKFGNSLVLLAALGIFSHMLLDIGGAVSYLYPLDSAFYKITLNIKITHFLPALFFSVEKALPVEQGLGTFISEPGFGVLALLAMLIVCTMKLKRKKAGKTLKQNG